MTKEKLSQLNRYKGAIHIHSKFSDGTGDVKSICRAAKSAGLDWIIITDHNNMDIQEGFIEGVCVIKGEEISPRDNHYLALGINNLISHELPPEKFVEELRNQGGFGIAAHPDESNTRKNDNRSIRWLDKNLKPDGVEIWNWFSTWGDNYSDKNIFTLIYAFLFKHKFIYPPKTETLSWWDELNRNSSKIIPAIGGVDAHALKVNKYLIPVKVFPYSEVFKTITNVIYLNSELSNDFDVAEKQILDAVKEGKNLIVNRKVCKNIPEIFVENIGKRAYCGENINCDDNTFMVIKLDKKFHVKILKNGKEILSKRMKNFRFKIKESGKYRVEISLGKLGYAYSNPIIIK